MALAALYFVMQLLGSIFGASLTRVRFTRILTSDFTSKFFNFCLNKYSGQRLFSLQGVLSINGTVPFAIHNRGAPETVYYKISGGENELYSNLNYDTNPAVGI